VSDSARVSRCVVGALIIAAALLPGCQKGDSAKAAPPAAPAPVAVHTVSVTPRNVPIRFTLPGQVEGSKEVEVRARVSGILQKQFYREGDPVRQGAPLFEIDRAPYEVALSQAKGQLSQAAARADQTVREEARLKPLVDERAVSRKEYDDAISARQLAEASLQQAKAGVEQAELNLSYTHVNAPVAGISGRATHSVGTLITTDTNGSLLTTINQLSPIWVRFSLAESDLAKIPGGRVGRGTPLDVQVLFADGTPYDGKGQLNFAATAIDSKLGTQQLRAEFANPREQLLPGQFVNVVVNAGQRDNVFLVPQAAVVQTEKTNMVFVVDPQGNAQARPVQMGDWIGSDWTVVAGLKSGDRVIVDNLLKVRPGAPVTEAPAAAAAAAAAPAAPAK
jgi:membrane fusion protein (multidrug efflux system)